MKILDISRSVLSHYKHAVLRPWVLGMVLFVPSSYDKPSIDIIAVLYEIFCLIEARNIESLKYGGIKFT